MPTTQRDIHKVFSATAVKGADGTHRFTISTGEVDRDGDRIDPNGWNLTAYRQNPTVLWGHDLKSLPIGKCTSIDVVNGKLKGTIEWPPSGIYPFADTVHALVNSGHLRSASVGFRADAQQPNEYGGHNITRATLLEWSVVNIPSNPSATLERGIDHMKFKSWLGGCEQSKEDHMPYLELDDEKYLEVSDDFDALLARLRQGYQEMEGGKFLQLMEAQISLLGPAATIADLSRALMAQGVYAPKHWDVDPKELAIAVSQVIADEVGKQTRAALNAAVGRLD